MIKASDGNGCNWVCTPSIYDNPQAAWLAPLCLRQTELQNILDSVKWYFRRVT